MTTALQPIVDLDSGLLAGVEALARFEDGRSPHVWFGDALKTGQALELDAFAFHAALTTLAWVPPGCYLSVNATPELLLSGLLQRGLLDSGLPLDQLVIEVTEHAPVGCYPDLQRALSELRGRGVRLAVDDTGAGYASLSHVLQLRPSIIKIDRSLITDVSTDQARRSLVTALVLLGLDLGATVTGEGIETVEERRTLTDLGVGFGQGYLLARPSTNRSDWQQWASRNWLSGPGEHARSLPSPIRR
jgi:EAL domain-containing protein (putative c-di-GMP-specific phosphodiesterase class I)